MINVVALENHLTRRNGMSKANPIVIPLFCATCDSSISTSNCANKVEPCEKCISKVRGEGYREGYGSGYKLGMRHGRISCGKEK